MANGQKPNKLLFSQHYLEHRIQECPEWLVDVRVGFEATVIVSATYDHSWIVYPNY